MVEVEGHGGGRVWRCSGANREAGCARIKVERWELPGGKVAFEVSRNGKDRPADLEEFLSQVVRPLLVVGAKPLADSKTELGSAC